MASPWAGIRRRLGAVVASRARVDGLKTTVDVLERRLASLEMALVEAGRGRELRPALWNVVPGASVGPPATLAERTAISDPQELVERLDVSLRWFDGLAAGEDLAALGRDALLRRVTADDHPLPAPAEREGYFATDDMAYWLSGLADVLLLERLAAERGRPLSAGQRVLDFGCASGRTLRHLLREPEGLDLHGTDIGVHNVAWIRERLPPAICAHQATILPRLPFEDASVDVIHAGSVFTHIDDRLEEATLLELRRVLHPEGFALLTVHPERDWAALCAGTDHWVAGLIHGAPHRLDPLGEPVTPELLARLALAMPTPRMSFVRLGAGAEVNSTNVVHSDAWIAERWGRHFEIEQIVPRAHGVSQDGVVLSLPR